MTSPDTYFEVKVAPPENKTTLNIWGPKILVLDKALNDDQLTELRKAYTDGGWSLLIARANQIVPGGITYNSEMINDQ